MTRALAAGLLLLGSLPAQLAAKDGTTLHIEFSALT